MGNWKTEIVDILQPGSFVKTGVQKTVEEAHLNGDWLGSFNLWVLTRKPTPSILYQQRSFDSPLWPGLLDVTVGGHYMAGENPQDGLREAREEIGKDYEYNSLLYLGRKLAVWDKLTGEKLRYCVDVFLVEDNDNLTNYKIQREELEGLFVCPINELLGVHSGEVQYFMAQGISFSGNRLKSTSIKVDIGVFPENWDNYHYKMVVLANDYFRGDHVLLY